jgi:hypothetical protein
MLATGCALRAQKPAAASPPHPPVVPGAVQAVHHDNQVLFRRLFACGGHPLRPLQHWSVGVLGSRGAGSGRRRGPVRGAAAPGRPPGCQLLQPSGHDWPLTSLAVSCAANCVPSGRRRRLGALPWRVHEHTRSFRYADKGGMEP